MLSIADVPYKFFNFKGIICSLIIDGYEYRFATYNKTKILKYNVTNNIINITLKKGKFYLNIKSIYDKGNKLAAPVNGKMIKDVYESINSIITVTLKKNEEIIFSDTSTHCGLEISY